MKTCWIRCPSCGSKWIHEGLRERLLELHLAFVSGSGLSEAEMRRQAAELPKKYLDVRERKPRLEKRDEVWKWTLVR